MKKLLLIGLCCIINMAYADLFKFPEYNHPECAKCYEQQQWCYDMEEKQCTEKILPCVKSQCTHTKRPQERWYINLL